MKAAQLHKVGNIENLKIEEIPIPEPEDNEVQIKIACAAINPLDWKICEGFEKEGVTYRFPITLGCDLSGIISKKGKKVRSLKEGDAIFAYCLKKNLHEGSFAEYICLEEDWVVKKPPSLSFAQAASVPASALTAWQSLFDVLKIQANETIFINGGSGGVGSFAIQFAKWAHTYVITSASTNHIDYVKALGADQVIDYSKNEFVDLILKQYPKGVDVVFVASGDEALEENYHVIKEGGRFATIIGNANPLLATCKRLKQDVLVLVEPNSLELETIANMLAIGTLRSPHITHYAFEHLIEALKKSREGHVCGKLVVTIDKTLGE